MLKEIVENEVVSLGDYQKEQLKNKKKQKLGTVRKPTKLSFQLATLVIPLVVLIVLTASGIVNSIANWFKDNTLRIQSPIVMKTQKVVVIEKIQQLPPVVQFVYDGEVDTIDTPLEEKIYQVFGKDYPTAIAVAKAESGMECNKMHVNKDGSVDFSLFQINSVHMDRWTLQELADCDRNIEIAKILVDEQGWGIWVAYSNGSWLAHLD